MSFKDYINEISEIQVNEKIGLVGSILGIKTREDLVRQLQDRFPNMINIKISKKTISIDGKTFNAEGGFDLDKRGDLEKAMKRTNAIEKAIRSNTKLMQEWKKTSSRFEILQGTIKTMIGDAPRESFGEWAPRDLNKFANDVRTVAKMLDDIPDFDKTLKDYEVLRLALDGNSFQV